MSSAHSDVVSPQHEGAEPWLIEEIMSAHAAAVKAANYLEFAAAEFARELNEAPELKAKLEADTRQRDESRRQATERAWG